MCTPVKWMLQRSALGLLAIAAALCSTVSTAQLKSVDHGAAAVDHHGLMWANTIGVELTWNPAGGPGTAQAWIANLNATDYGGFDDWTLPTGDFLVGPNATSNQLGELFYTDCGNVLGQQTALTIPTRNCRALSVLRSAIKVGTTGFGGGRFPGAILISSGTFLGPVSNYYSWAVYDTSSSSERYWDSDTSYAGLIGVADVLAVRFAGGKTKTDVTKNVAVTHGLGPNSVPEPDTFALLGIGLVGLVLGWWRHRRRRDDWIARASVALG